MRTYDLWHVDAGPREEGLCLGTYRTRDEAEIAGRRYWRDVDPGAWLQTQESDQRDSGRDVDRHGPIGPEPEPIEAVQS